MLRARWHLLLLIASVAGLPVLLFGACSGRGGATSASPAATSAARLPAAEEYAARGPYGAGVMTIDLTDASRPTAANRDAPASPVRTMQVEVWYPAGPDAEMPEQRDAPLERSGARYPLIIFAHGFSAFRRQSASFMQGLASHGYIVAAPDFPQSRIDAPGGPRLSAVLDQPGDVSFVIDELLARDGEAGWPLRGAIDAERIGMSGHSLGALTTLLTAYGSGRDARLKAILPISPVGCLFPASVTSATRLPVMVVGGSREKIVDPSSIKRAYDAAPAPKYRVEVIGGDHVRFADIDTTDDQLGDIVSRQAGGDLVGDALKIAQADGADASTCLTKTASSDELVSGERQRELLRTAATPFFDAYLKGDAAAMRFLRESLPSLAGVRVESTGTE